MPQEYISIRGARVHNLKNIDVNIPKNKLVVITGLSGSGKSSLAFDTIYAEGQRRYMESLSSYARQFLELQDKPDVDEMLGLSPTIAIDQKSSSHNPRSTVGTVTEIYDFLRVLFARAGRPHCPKCGAVVQEQTLEQMTKIVEGSLGKDTLLLFAPVVSKQKGEHKHVLQAALNAGFTRVRYDGLIIDTDEAVNMRKDKKKDHDLDVLIFAFQGGQTYSKDHITQMMKKALDYGNGFVTLVNDENGDERSFSQSFMCVNCGLNLPKPEPRLFSFNSPYGACTECTGLGEKLVLEPELVIPNGRLTLEEGAIRPWSKIAGNQTSYLRMLDLVGKKHKIPLDVPVEKIPKAKMDVILYGTGAELYSFDSQEVVFPGVLAQLEQKYRETDSDYVRSELEGYMRRMLCPGCSGKRLQPAVLAITIADKSIADIVNMPVEDVKGFFEGVLGKGGKGGEGGKGKKEEKQNLISGLSGDEQLVTERVGKEVCARLAQLTEVGLGYLTLDRSAMTLSGGEAQRVRLASQLGSGLSGVIYILDEPSIGLHPRDNDRLIQTIRRLQEFGNSVIVVEHDEAMIQAADYVFDVGPGAGEYGGEIVAEGTAAQIKKNKHSLTGLYLSGDRSIPLPKKYRKGNGKSIDIVGATAFNLQNVSVSIPLGKLVCITGVSGSGKSTLILDILGKSLSKHFYRAKEYPGAHKAIKGIEHIDKVVAVDQSPIGRTPRSNPATYTGVFTAIRDLYTEVPEAKMRNFDAGKFSFNVKGGGRCETCSGDGVRRIEMQFLPDVYVECTECRGTRYNQEVLEVHYKQKNISDILNMTVEEARRFFADQTSIFEKLDVLHEVGLGYIRLGQSATTLSGGEAQRVKLSTELSRRATGRTLYILDEPTTGLHFEDIKRLLGVLHMLVDKGNTVVIIEHNLDVIKGADWVVDMGPDGGIKGGKLVAEGTPKDIVKVKESITGKYLKSVL
ncbi:excinuclease ABC subunit A [Candidatus Uhrbacteria bacterium RIFCSPHIGHO2_02_FULL_47_44]|uniref:UvrABC system protein A n=1 Tax=Candidatus Uhrbacteria bacterium RIFCSPLOWO2_02_FULL_48_18 TaxID=1802408 RepID=A0A1F7V7J7_9BACT|nr:MAG: excinuclease ABC subunit A [Candidatus Uhrbacteria bacterium RIFCSPHIGHO2_01_FULL_47_10]OGL71319.1 MAG: excinuclease ABC subunit A [Candidatus Uhrbacteria bacterium RIFCSPHIGHO2_02_FULL_47_44]OGL80822.1 MAG: excinuclease ABC subunit A [Candidatus Uhrbacteria bacterium RIFCSPLOWO2_01_FULL_47_17]OGL86385.1 MAG: excinuclease ABC subunit A [Candidatus Uhrbacteria bacterium RIFCSPLOWO2_02_FULL_48_18]OGL93261.1 MAG: excinuclease ABC subunit A [Candidatus Uhrbacteria bacterium RIFCSPLOWO2_12_F